MKKRVTVLTIPLLLLATVIAGAIAFFAFTRSLQTPLPRKATLPQAESVLRIGELEIPVEIADTPLERSRGLSGRPYLDENRGMLFVFDQPGIHHFWMPEMHFSIDFVWIDAEKRIIGITENVPPLADAAYPLWYAPPAPARYVLEVNAGFSRRHNIQIDDFVTLQ